MIRLLYIARFKALAVLLLLLLALAPAMAQTVVYTGDTTPLEVVQVPGDTYKWELYDNGNGNFATKTDYCPSSSADFAGGVDTGPSVNVNWLKPGIYFFKVTATNITGCTMNLAVGMIEVKIAVNAVITPPTAAVCEGEPVSLEITLSGTAPWNFTYQGTDINGLTSPPVTITGVTDNPYTLVINPGPTLTTDYQITKVSDINGENTAGSNTVTQTINPLPKPSAIYHR